MRRIRSKIDNLLVYHHNLDSNDTINLVKGFKRGDLVFIRKFITKENVNSSIGIFGYFPLELTIIYDQKHVFEYLVNELGANVNIKNKSLETMHFVALAFQRRNYLFELLNLDMNNLYECTNGSQRTLMHEAAICGDGETVYRLLNEYGFYKNLNEFELSHLLYDKYSCTPLYYACWFGYIDIVEQLLDSADESLSSVSYSRLNSSITSDCQSIENGNENFDDVFLCHDTEKELNEVISPEFHSIKTKHSKPAKIEFEDSSLAISILYKRFDCVKLLIKRSTKCSFFRMKKTSTASLTSPKIKVNEDNSTELDCWFAASMKLDSLNDFMSMRDIFHELVLNGCKFSNYLFSLIDSMSELKQFKFDVNTRDSGIPTFSYNSYMSYFIKSLTFVCNYNLEKLFKNTNQCELFLKSVFLKINELLLVNEKLFANKNVIETDSALDGKSNLDWFKSDLKKLLKQLFLSNLGFKYFPNKKFFNFLKKKHSIYHLILNYLYSYNNNHYSNSISMGDRIDPLKLSDLSKLKIKSTLVYLDLDLISRLCLPRHMNQFVGAELSPGLGQSYERQKLNKFFAKTK